MNVYTKLRRRFVITCVIIVALTLAVVFGSAFGITSASADSLVSELLDNELQKAASVPPAEVGSNSEESETPSVLIVKTDKNGKIFQSHNSVFSEKELSELLNSAHRAKTNKFEYGGRLYRYATETKESGATYAFFDYTPQKNTIKALLHTLAILYALCLLFAAGCSWLLSGKIVSPVKEAMDKQKELIANASHELKTPLTILSTNLDIVTNSPEKTVAENEKWLSVSNTQISKMNDLIIEMLELSRLDAKSGEVSETSDLSSVVEGVVLSFEAGCYDKNIELIHEITPNLYTVGERMQLEKAVSTILDNAVKYTPAGGKITATLVKKLHTAELTVRNTGEGIAPENIDRIFDRFYKADTARTESSAKSFGLGLSIAKSIAEHSGGDIICRSKVGEYTEFVITLPIKKN